MLRHTIPAPSVTLNSPPFSPLRCHHAHYGGTLVPVGTPATLAARVLGHAPLPHGPQPQASTSSRCVQAAATQSRDTGGGSLRDEDVLQLQTFLELYKAKSQGPPQGPGEVYLIGTGPGDPGLLTLRAAQLMQTADVVLYDRLVSDEIMELVNPGARMLYVGKTAGFHTRSQTEIHTLLLAFAEAGARVVRLKGGDPYVFGRGGEEVQYLMAHGIKVHCVPGITAAAGICAELGIPMTHRGVATSVRFLTGHSREGGEEQLDDTTAVASDPHTTLIVYMGLQTLGKLTQQLYAAGIDRDLPAVAVERGTTSARRVVYGCVSDLQTRTTAAGLKSPTLIILGAVVALSPGWSQWQQAGRPLEWNEATTFPEFQFNPAAFSLAPSSMTVPGAAAGVRELSAV